MIEWRLSSDERYSVRVPLPVSGGGIFFVPRFCPTFLRACSRSIEDRLKTVWLENLQAKKDACTGERMRLRSSRRRLSRPRERESVSA
jgi:hypothetical protein